MGGKEDARKKMGDDWDEGRRRRYRAFERLRTFFAVAIAENGEEDCARIQA